MTGQGTINLLKITQEVTPSQSPIEKKFQRISAVICSGVLLLALLTGAVFAALKWQLASLAATRERLTQAIADQSNKEILYHALKERITIVADIKKHQRSWSSWFDLVGELAGPPVLKQVTGTTSEGLNVTLHVKTLEEVSDLAQILTSFYTRKDIEKPKIVSYSFSDQEGITMILGFLPKK